MYGFPTQTEQETIDSLEVVRQLFSSGIIQSAYWHRFSMTAHSAIGIQPQEFGVSKDTEEIGTFANNDLFHNDPDGGDHSKFGYGLRKSLLNFMHGMGFDADLQDWFDFNIPQTTVSSTRIDGYLNASEFQEINPNQRLVWVGQKNIQYRNLADDKLELIIETKSKTALIPVDKPQGEWLLALLKRVHISNSSKTTYSQVSEEFNALSLGYFLLFWNEKALTDLRQIGLLIL
jgi:hypothetical protein